MCMNILHECMYVYHVCVVPMKARGGIGSPEEQSVLFTADPSLQRQLKPFLRVWETTIPGYHNFLRLVLTYPKN